MSMIFYPSESFVLGLFILMAVMLVLYISLRFVDTFFTYDTKAGEREFMRLVRRVKFWLLVVTVAAFACGVYASFIPGDLPTVEISDVVDSE
ncbi:hypothetical protein CPT_Slocum_006 [Serratia phage Slocum]|nr:hypothetical protein CPT_Slocum_006 [Serratia phage Slocum]